MVQWRSSTLSGMPKSESNWSPGKTRWLGAGVIGSKTFRHPKNPFRVEGPLNYTYWGDPKLMLKSMVILFVN